ncbi:MAG: hypothetical protein HYY93_16980 [Planctomycetes bacterium]|nr:hypothetical protein [Planctomycetota bacterium]
MKMKELLCGWNRRRGTGRSINAASRVMRRVLLHLYRGRVRRAETYARRLLRMAPHDPLLQVLCRHCSLVRTEPDRLAGGTLNWYGIVGGMAGAA